MGPTKATEPENSVLYEPSSEGITLITINRPHVRNAVNSTTARLLAEAFRRFEHDPAQKVCILTGAGGQAFCAGYDLHEVARSPTISNIGPATADHHHASSASPPRSDNGPPSSPSPPPTATRVQPVTTTDPLAPLPSIQGPMGPSRMLLTKPLFAAVQGPAVAGGLELSLLADLRVCDPTAVFGVFCRRFGVPLIDGGTVRLPRVVGLGRAMDMILTGRPVDAHEALAMGLASRVVARGAAVEEARRIARALLAFPQACMRGDKRSAYYGAFDAASMEDALRYEYEKGMGVIEKESVPGAIRFDQGEGRGGSFQTNKAKL